MAKKCNMRGADRSIRFFIGCSFIYLGFTNTGIIGDSLLNASVGVFGLMNLISAIVGICPAYLLADISTLKNKSEKFQSSNVITDIAIDSQQQSNDLLRMRQKLMLSVAIPMLGLLILFGWTVFNQKHESVLAEISQKQDAATLIALKTLSDSSTTHSSENVIIQELLVDTDVYFMHDAQMNRFAASFEKGIQKSTLIDAVHTEIASFDSLDKKYTRGMLAVDGVDYVWSTHQVDNNAQWLTAVWKNPDSHVLSSHIFSSRFLIIVLVVAWMAIWSSTYIVRKFAESMKDNAKKLYFRSMHDPLTELPNRLKIETTISEYAKSVSSNSESIVLMMVDLIEFRDINDTLGNVMGDELLKRVGNLLRELESDDVTVHRMGGDVFCVVCKTNQNRIETSRIANTIHDKLEHRHELNGVPVALQVRVGMSSYPIDTTDPQELVRLADIALAQAKRQRVKDCFFQHEQDTHSVRKLTLLSRLRTAIEQDELTLVYQPKVNILDNSLAGVEVLVRWTDAEYGPVSPVEFVTWAEKSGLINKLTHWVLINAEKQCREWRDRGYVIPFAVNLSPTNLSDKDLIPLISDLVEKGSFGNGMLELELTENAVMEDPDKALATMKILENMGVSFAIDDFGTGLSSFTYLRKFPVTNLKIDRAFVMDIDDSDRDAILLQSMVQLGHSLGCVVTAEGAEDQAAIDRLRGFKCNHVQGFHICKPLQADQLINWVSKNEWTVDRKAA